MGSNCDSIADSLPWATCQVLTWILTSLWSLFFPVLALTLTMCYHVKAASSSAVAFNFGANGRTPVFLGTAARIWSWRLATLLVYVPQSYISFLVMRWAMCWMLDVFGPKVRLSNIFFLLIASATMAITFLLSVAAVVVLLIHLLWNTVDIFVIREQNRIQDEEATTATATEVSPLLPSSQALVRGDSTPAVQIPDYRHSTPRLPDTPQCPSTHPRPRSPPLSDIMLPVPGDSPPDFNPYGISWVLGPWNPISIMLWIRACSQAARDDQHLERVSDDGAGDLDPFCPPVLNP